MYSLPSIAKRFSLHLLLALTLCANWSTIRAANISWTGGDGNWSNPVRWQPFGVPTPADFAFIGNAGVAETTVSLDQNDSIAGLVITNQMRLNTEGNNLFVNGATSIDGGAGFFTNDSRLNILQGSIVTTQDLMLIDGGSVFLDEGRYDITGTATIGAESSISGQNGSTIRLFQAAGPALVNNGELLGHFDGGFVIDQVSTGRIDLDGDFGDGVVLADRTNIPGTEHSTITVNGDQLYDEFNSSMRLHQGGTINMNLSDGWTMGFGSVLRFAGDQSYLNGGEVTLSGEVIAAVEGQGRVNADAVLTSAVEVELFREGELEFHGETRILGGNFEVGEDGLLLFEGPTSIEGGAFTTFSNLSADGSVQFNGATEYDGIVTINGIARQNGDADIEGPTTINTDILDMDGGGSTTWNVGNGLTINAAGVDSTISNGFDGTINIGGGFLSKITINLDDPADLWTMAGEMNLSGLAIVPFPMARVAGSPMRVTGELNVSEAIGVSAPTTFDNSSLTSFADADTLLVLSGASTVRPNATFIGQGTLVNTSPGGMTLEDGASLDEVGLENAGLLEVGDSPGVAAVARFGNTEDGTWLVEIGGLIAGDEHDLLLVTDGETLLDGLIEVELIDVGGGLFLPEIGDEFTVLTSFGAVSGAFTNDPVSFSAGQSFYWEVLHHPNDVTLRLVDIGIVPEPTTFLLGALGIVFYSTVRHKKISLQALSMATVVTCTLDSSPSLAADKVGTARSNESWSTATNWSSNGGPRATDTVYLGNLPAIENSGVILNQCDFALDSDISDFKSIQGESRFFVAASESAINETHDHAI